MLPGLDGMSASRQIARVTPQVPIIIVSALSERDNLLQGFALGVDDYVTKPVDIEVLLARISASLRRASARGRPSALAAAESTVQLGALVIDTDTRSLRTPSGEVPLTPKEHGLLQLLVAQPGHLFSREPGEEAGIMRSERSKISCFVAPGPRRTNTRPSAGNGLGSVSDHCTHDSQCQVVVFPLPAYLAP